MYVMKLKSNMFKLTEFRATVSHLTLTFFSFFSQDTGLYIMPGSGNFEILRKKNTFTLSIYNVFVLKTSSAYYICSIYSKALQNSFSIETNIMKPDQTAPKGAV